MDYKIDDNVKISELSVTDNEIRTLARKVIDSEHIIRSVVIITSSQKNGKNGIVPQFLRSSFFCVLILYMNFSEVVYSRIRKCSFS